MPKELPAASNLEHLKKQAKALLSEFRQGNPGATQRLRSHDVLRADQEPQLADAQRVIAREYGFLSWSRLKEHVEEIALEKADPQEEFKAAIRRGDASRVSRLAERYPSLRDSANAPILGFDSPPILIAAQSKNRELVEVLLNLGANINARSQWWAGGFGVFDWADKEFAQFLMERGAVVDVHAAAHLAMLPRLKELIESKPELVNARGGDGKTPLHCASTVEVAEYLLDRGAKIDARDIDHESTAAQYLLREHPDVVRYLIQRGCTTDMLMAAALDDRNLAQAWLSRNPESIRTRVSDEYFPMVRPKGGGTIYQWLLGWYVSPHQVAKKFGHQAMFEWLMARTPPEEKLLNACWLGDEPLVRQLLLSDANLALKLPPAGRRHVAHAARANDLEAVKLMLSAGLPLDQRSQHGGTAMHWAAYHGNVSMVEEILRHAPALDAVDDDFSGTPLDWAIHGSKEGDQDRTGRFVMVVRLLLDAGAKPPKKADGSPALVEELRRRGVPGS
jgi:ankyrin repeat protein